MTQRTNHFGSYGEALEVVDRLLATTKKNFDASPSERLRHQYETLLKVKDELISAWDHSERIFSIWLEQQAMEHECNPGEAEHNTEYLQECFINKDKVN